MLGVAPSVDWLDTGSLASSAWMLGVAHPPGEPGWLAPARLAMLVPVGDLAFRVNVLSALCVAACAWPLVWLTRAAVGRDVALGPAFAVGVGLLGFGARMQAHRAEVYGLVALLLLLALAASVCLAGRRATAALALLLGMAAAVHPLLAAAATPALLIARGIRSAWGMRDLPIAAAFGLTSFAAYGWLPVRAMANPARAWGVPDSPGRFVDVLLGRAFAGNFGGEAGSLLDNLGVVLGRHALSGTLTAAGFAAVGWFVLRATEPSDARRALLWAAPLWVLGNAMTILPQNKVFGSNPDVLGYLLVGALAVAPLGGLGVQALRDAPLARFKPALLGLAALAVGMQLFAGFSAHRTTSHAARQFATAQSHALPPGATLFTSGNNTAFVWTYLQSVERRRPDMTSLHRVLLGHEHERLRLQAALRSAGIPWTPVLRAQPAKVLVTVPDVFIEVRDPERAMLHQRLRPHGLVWAMHGPRESPELAALRERTVAAMEASHRDDEARAVAALFRANQGAPR